MLIGGQMTNDDSMIQDDQRQDASKLSKAYISQSQSQWGICIAPLTKFDSGAEHLDLTKLMKNEVVLLRSLRSHSGLWSSKMVVSSTEIRHTIKC